MPQRAAVPWQSDMPVAGKLLLSAAALLLLTLAFRFYRSRSLAGGKTPLADEGQPGENLPRARDGDGDKDGDKNGDGDKDGDGAVGPRRRRVWARLGPAGRERELGRELGSRLGCELGSKSEGKPGTEQGSDPGIEPGSKLGNELQNELGSELGSEPGSKLGSKPGNNPGSMLVYKLGNESGSELGSKSGTKSGNKLGNEAGNKLASKPGSKLGSKSGTKPGIEQRSDLESKLGSKLRNEAGSEWASEPGSKLGNDLGMELGTEPSSHDPGNVAETLSSHSEKETLAPSTGVSPGISKAQMADDGCSQSTEKDLAGGSMSRENKENRESIRTLSVTSNLGLLMTVSDAESDTSYSFSSVAKIQVEENYIPERQGKDRDNWTVPGLRGKVYNYYVQSISESVLKKKCLPYIPPGMSRSLAARDPTTSSTVPPPTRSSEASPEPPSPGRRKSILQIADSPHLQLPMEGFGVTAPAGTPPPGSPQPGLVASPDPTQLPPDTPLDLGNCYEVLSTAKAQGLRALQEAAYRVMSDNYLQVLRTPSIYGRLNAGERELILRRRMEGKMFVVVADVSGQEPDLRPGRLCYYDEGGDCWHHLCHVPPEVLSRGCAMCSMFNYLFVVSGCEGTGRARRPSNRVFCYDPLTDVWREICPLNQARPRCKLVALDGHLYAIGGECLCTVECYDPRCDRWAFAAPLPHDTFAAPSCSLPPEWLLRHQVFNIDMDTQHMVDFRVEEHGREVGSQGSFPDFRDHLEQKEQE
ncbi:kelch domain-containing protein 7A [Manacus vitellinus]|uniref:kelch domain-containing protein 7A n=1 Tax=Manacus vitellinus TaxID=328815 RepID=UPI00115D50B2|nr:kelch domain-containing protein 7A [Manacus vitellinus]